MPIPTPFHERTAPLCTSMRWKDWAGYHAVCSYGTYMPAEYFAIRHAAGLVDVTPLFKYDVRGRDAAAVLSRIMVRDITALKVGQVVYSCWCDDDGKVVDDGTVWRLEEQYFRMTSAEPAIGWLMRFVRGCDVQIQDVSRQIAALSLQGPNAREILKQVAGPELDRLRFFRLLRCRIAGSAGASPSRVARPPSAVGPSLVASSFDAIITRTGYTGDLGYEIWVENRHALALYDALLAAGKPVGLLPAGLDAQDVCRVEAGFILNGVDYYSAPHCLIEKRKSTPYELDLGWMVKLDREPFVGQAALRREHARGPRRVLVGLEIDWDHFAALHAEHGLPPEVPTAAWRTPVPVYDARGRQVGYATSGVWSPTLKKNLALATVRPAFGKVGTELRFEVTVEYERRLCKAFAAAKPFFDPERKKATPGGERVESAPGSSER